jgi:hypothetical protein
VVCESADERLSVIKVGYCQRRDAIEGSINLPNAIRQGLGQLGLQFEKRLKQVLGDAQMRARHADQAHGLLAAVRLFELQGHVRVAAVGAHD